ncbi:MAG: CPBP family intramembrane metalloprotease [Candidatus Azobacteroides sp.]|nr:CPBP family intramembrane metalloprotease [Candidatus Azobacteroides sp.]
MQFLERSLDQQNQFWKYLIVVLAAFFGGQILGAIPLASVMIYKVITSGGAFVSNPKNLTDLTAFGISKNVSLFLFMLIPVVFLLITILLIKVLHKRSFAETVNGTQKVRIKRCLTGAAVWSFLMAIYYWGDYMMNPENYRLQFNLLAFIPLLLISVILIPIQTTSEEFFFRGYLSQGFAGWTKNRWLAILIPGLLFGLTHSANPEVKEFGFWVSMSQYVFFGLLFGLVSVLDDGIELAMGMHAANNVFLSLFVTNYASALQTDAVFEELHIVPVKETISLIIIGMITLAFFAWKYQWNFKILNQKIIKL